VLELCEFAKIKGAKIILYVNLPTFRATKLKGFTVHEAMTHLRGSHSFTCHPHIQSTCGMSHTCLYCLVKKHHHILASIFITHLT